MESSGWIDDAAPGGREGWYLPEVVELDLNPVFVRPEGGGVVAVDVRCKLRPAD